VSTTKITWPQFVICSNNEKGIEAQFEDLCRQIIYFEILSENKNKNYPISSPNNPGIETEPLFDEIRGRWIGFQAKFFDSKIDYTLLEKSVDNTIKYYKERINHLYIFTNKPITITSKSYQRILNKLKSANITIDLISDNVILDIVRSHSNLALYYFGQDFLTYKWVKDYNQDIFSKIGNRYNVHNNIDTKTSEVISLFTCDKYAVNYINNKKKEMLKKMDAYNWGLYGFFTLKKELKKTVLSLNDVDCLNVEDSFEWDKKIRTIATKEIKVIEDALIELEKNYELLIFQGGNPEKLKEINLLLKLDHKTPYNTTLNNIIYKKDKFNEFLEMMESLKINDEERQIIHSKIFFLKGEAGVGKTHILANQVNEMLLDGKMALMLLGGDYIEEKPVLQQISSGMYLKHTFLELLDILNTEGQKRGYIIPIVIDALNESWMAAIWKKGLSTIINKIKNLSNLKLIISYRSEYEDMLILSNEKNKKDVYVLEHKGFIDVPYYAIEKFLNYYGILFSPLHFFNSSLTNPLFLTLYCKTYDGNEIDLFKLYERLLDVSNEKIFESMYKNLNSLGYYVTDKILHKVVFSIANSIVHLGKRFLTKNEINNLDVWDKLEINPRSYIKNMIFENILCSSIINNEEIYYFVFDHMNDYFSARVIFSKFNNKKEIYDYFITYLTNNNNNFKFQIPNLSTFIILCSLFEEKYKTECIEIINFIKSQPLKNSVINSYIESLEWRNASEISLETLFVMVKDNEVDIGKIWGVFINNSLKLNNKFNAESLHNILLQYKLSERDYYWTTYINDFEEYNDNRAISIVKMYSQGRGLEISDDYQAELLMTMLIWFFTSSNRWLRDNSSQAVVEILKNRFHLAEKILRKFINVNDPYVIQRLYGVIWGACMKRSSNNGFSSLVKYIYENIFCANEIIPDIILRDYARLIIERYLYEYPYTKDIDKARIMPPYNSSYIPSIDNQGYLEKEFGSGVYSIISSMRFEGSGWYGDFGRYVFQSALRRFDLSYEEMNEIFNYSIYYILNDLGYSEELFGNCDSYIKRFNFSRHNHKKTERIGKKYQWIAMYNVLARVSDNCRKTSYYYGSYDNNYVGPWDPFVRDYDPTLNVFNMLEKDFTNLEKKANVENEVQILLEDTYEKISWIRTKPSFFKNETNNLLVIDSDGTEWIKVMAHNEISDDVDIELKIWSMIHGFFVTNKQYEILKVAKEIEPKLIIDDVMGAPRTYEIYNREYPWANSCKTINQNTLINVSLLNLGIMPAFIELIWEQLYDSSKNGVISWYTPCADFILNMELQYGQYDTAFYDKNGKLATFYLRDASNHFKSSLFIRKDLFDSYLKKRGYKFLYFQRGEKSLFSLEKQYTEYFSGWFGLIEYKENKTTGEIILFEDSENMYKKEK